MSLTASAVTIINFANITPAQAQLFPEQSPTREREYDAPRPDNSNYDLPSNTVPEGFLIPVEYKEEKILVTPEETVPITLSVAANVKDSRGNILIPYGSEISGQIQPSDEQSSDDEQSNDDEQSSNEQSGSQFVAEEIVFPDGTSHSIDAVSDVVTRRETVEKGANAGDILTGAVIGAGAAAILSDIFGDMETLEVLGGAGAGAIGGVLLGGNKAELVSIDPNNDLDLTLQSDLAIR
ncbi:MAG: hypothetical protein ACRC2S_20695 [Waterburya sp.]